MMRQGHECDGCGGGDFRVTPSFAAQIGDEPVETLVWECAGCGGETLVVEVLVGPIDARAATRRRRAA